MHCLLFTFMSLDVMPYLISLDNPFSEYICEHTFLVIMLERVLHVTAAILSELNQFNTTWILQAMSPQSPPTSKYQPVFQKKAPDDT